MVWQSLLQRGVVEDEAGTQAMYSLNKQVDKTMVGDRVVWKLRPAGMLVGKQADCGVRNKPELQGVALLEAARGPGKASLIRPWPL